MSCKTYDRYRQVLTEIPEINRTGRKSAEQNRFAIYLLFAEKAKADGETFSRPYLEAQWQRPVAESTFGIMCAMLREFYWLDDSNQRTDKPIPRKWDLRGLDVSELPPVTAYRPKPAPVEEAPHCEEVQQAEEEEESAEEITEEALTERTASGKPVYTALVIREDAKDYSFEPVTDDFDIIKEIIGCNWCEICWWWIGSHRFAVVIDDQGRLSNRKPTVLGPNADTLAVGTAVIFGVQGRGSDMDFTSLTPEEMDMLETCMARMAMDGRTVLTNMTMREFAPWTLQGGCE